MIVGDIFTEDDRTRKGIIEFYKDESRAGEYRWRITASNGKKIASSGEGYKNKEDCKNGLASVKWHLEHSVEKETW